MKESRAPLQGACVDAKVRALACLWEQLLLLVLQLQRVEQLG